MNFVQTILNKRGLHARAAGKFVRIVGLFQAQITVIKGTIKADGLSIMELLMLQASQNDILTIEATGPESNQALQALQQLIQNKFGEHE